LNQEKAKPSVQMKNIPFSGVSMRRAAASLLLTAIFILGSAAVAQDKKTDAKKGPIPKILFAPEWGVEPGKTTKLTIRGIDVDQATLLQVHEPRSSGKILGNSKKIGVPAQQDPGRIGNSEIQIEITTPSELAVRELMISLGNANGMSAPHPLVVFDGTQRMAEKEPNNEFKEAQKIEAFPVIIEGKIAHERDVDVYSFTGQVGQTLHVEVQARQLGSPAEPMLFLHSENGTLLATDSRPNPELTWKLKRSERMFLSVIDVNDQGGGIHGYRVRLSYTDGKK
jgi:hypothetical protein